MALDTLIQAQQKGCEFLGIGAEELALLNQGTLYELGVISVAGLQGNAYRAQCGPEKLIGKGGIRIAPYATASREKAVVTELAAEMNAKLALGGHEAIFKGGKGLVSIDLNSLPPQERPGAAREIMGQFAVLMHKAGLAGAQKDVPAGDMGTNGISDVYAQQYHELNPSDPYWLASITGKIHEGGLPFRTIATGFGGYAAQQVVYQEMSERHNEVITSALQGAGNVGGWYGLYVSRDPYIRLGAVSDADGVLSTSDPLGIMLTEEMVREVCDNPHFKGPKIHTLAERLRADGQNIELTTDPNDILTYPTDHLVLAAMGNVITEDNMGKLGVEQAIIELANGPVTAKAHRQLVERGIVVRPDIEVNGRGVDCSIKEYWANLNPERPIPTNEKVQDELRFGAVALMAATTEMTARMGTNDYRAGAATLSLARQLAAHNIPVRSDIADLLN